MDSGSKLKGPRNSCPCTSCNGAQVSYSTILRHRKRLPPPPPQSDFPSFAEWKVLNAAKQPGDHTCFQNHGSEDRSILERCNEPEAGREEGTSRPYKKRRTDDNPDNHQRSENDSIHPHDQTTEMHRSRNITPPNDTDLEPYRDSPDETDSHPDDNPAFEEEDPDANQEQIDTARAEELRAQAVVLASFHALAPEPEAGVPANTADDTPTTHSRIEHVKFAQQFIEEISNATLDNGKLDTDVIESLRDPDTSAVDLSDPDIRLSLDLFMACNNASEETYKAVRASIESRFPEAKVLSYYSVKKLVANISGVVSILDDMCIKSCHAFTGPFADLQSCRTCSAPRYDPIQIALTQKKNPQKQACTIPLGPQIQALRRSQHGASAMRYRDKKIQEIFDSLDDPNAVYDDIFCGNDYLDLHERLNLTSDDTTVSFSIDGAQLYQNKKSDTWIAIWIIMDLHPNSRYKKKHVLPALIVPGPDKPDNLDSFMFRSFHHLRALQRENNGLGLCVWDALKATVISSRIIFILGTADAVALTELDGRVGHHGTHGCRLGCDMKGRHKPGTGHYYAVHLKPNNYTVEACNHPDYDFCNPPLRSSVENYHIDLAKVIASRNQAEYERNRKLTGISKPSILNGLDPDFTLPVPLCFSVDLMHLLSLNLGELLIPLWRGLLPCDSTDNRGSWDWVKLVDNVWTEHGKLVAAATQYFPSSFHRPPRNPAEKISSGYKATEYYLYLFGLGPAYFRTILPKKYWWNFCKLIHGVHILVQRSITCQQIREAHSYLVQFVEEFEHIYYQRRPDRIHFCRPVIHTLLHTAPEISRIGPGSYASQFTMERSIGDLGKDIHQPSNPFGNLCQLALRRSQINALKAVCPELDKDAAPHIPKFSHEAGSGYIFLRPRDRNAILLNGPEEEAVLLDCGRSQVLRWGRLRLPNGQVARSKYSESKRTAPNKRISRNVKMNIDGRVEISEVQFYFFTAGEAEGDNLIPYALVSLYGCPDKDMLEESCNTLWACRYRGPDALRVVSISSILTVVSMQPLPQLPGDPEDLWFVVEKSGLDDVELTGYIDLMEI